MPSLIDLADVDRQRAAPRRQGPARASASKSSCTPDLPMLQLDAVLFEQVLFNLLDNAAKYAPAGTEISVRAGAHGRQVACIDVLRRGRRHSAGRSRADLRQVLSRAGRRPEARRHGAGPGDLPRLRRGDGRHRSLAANRADRSGAVFTITLPMPRPRIAHRRLRHDRRPARCACWSSTTSRRSAASCVPASPPQNYSVSEAPRRARPRWTSSAAIRST